MGEGIEDAVAKLPPLWTTESLETEDIVLPIRLASRWHRLTWYPVERGGDVLFGLTLWTVPEWRHFRIDELLHSYAGFPVTVDRAHVPQRVPRVPEIAIHRLDDVTPFAPNRPKVWP